MNIRTRLAAMFTVVVTVATAIIGAVIFLSHAPLWGVAEVVGVTAVVATLASVASMWYIEKYVIKRLKVIGRATKEFARGNMDVRVRILHEDQVGAVGQAFNDMADSVSTAHRELTEKEALFRLLTEGSNDWICLHGDAGEYLHASPASRELLGYDPDELVGLRPYSLIHEDDRDRVRATAQKSIGSHSSGTVPAYRMQRKDGTFVWLESSISPAPVGSPEGATVISVSRDVTDRVEAEARIRALNETLEERVSQRTQELQDLNRELEAFNYSVSHDLRAPLRSIDGFSKLVLSRHSSQLDEQALDYLTRIRAAAQRMGILIDDLLKLSRIGRRDLAPKLIDLADVAKGTLAELEEAEPDRRVDIRIPAGLLVQADPGLMAIVTDNLVGNAWKFTSKTPDPKIEMGVVDNEGERVFFVADNGAGFDPTYAAKMFAPFQRLHRTEDFPGTGIGLATVAKAIRLHGGRIWAEGTPGAGATFFFTLDEKGMS